MGIEAVARAIYLAPITGMTKSTEINASRFHFPVTSPEFTKTGTGQWTTNNIIGLGEVAHPIGPGLATYTMSSFFPPFYSERLCKGLRDPSQFREPKAACAILDRLRDTNDIMWLVVGTELASTGLTITGESESNVIMDPVRITDFSWSEVAGRPDSRLFDITFAQWTQAKPGALVPFAIPKTYRPNLQEDLRDVAVRWYRDVNQWKRIYQANLDKYKKFPKVRAPLIPKETKGKFKGQHILLKLPSPV